ncbi:hypothetical protein DH2020_036435 [Rehmannia glutinosa]|uniref:Uncharacterized protein n=1 Tax=Rehmannia glutinosa TaxID=99300 RepID=A0ABR0V3Q2_REHGL
MAFPINIATSNSWNLNLPYNQPLQFNSPKIYVKPLNCMPLQQQVDSGIMCECCSGKGWLLCEFCKGQKTNVRAENNNRIYRRCPACRAIGSVLCSKCKVYRCVTFPDHNDGEELNF